MQLSDAIIILDSVIFAIMPLYSPLGYIKTGLGDRLGMYITRKDDFWWDYATDDSAKKSFQNVADAIDIYLMPWLEKYSIQKNYKKRLSKDKWKKFIGYPNQTWFEALDSPNKELTMQENIQKLKLPKKLIEKGNFKSNGSE